MDDSPHAARFGGDFPSAICSIPRGFLRAKAKNWRAQWANKANAPDFVWAVKKLE